MSGVLRTQPKKNLQQPPLLRHELLVIITNYACSLACKDCANFIPSMPVEVKRHFLDPEELKEDLASLAGVVRFDRIQIQGGESTLHRELDSILRITAESGLSPYIQLVTNGTHLLNDRVAAAVKQSNIEVRISNYGATRQHVRTLIEQLKTWQIRHSLYNFVGNDSQWFDMGGVDTPGNADDRQVQQVYAHCPFTVCWTLSDGWITKCSRSAATHHAGQHEFFPQDFVRIHHAIPEHLREELIRFRAGGFMETCRYCYGVDGKKITPGIQRSADINAQDHPHVSASFNGTKQDGGETKAYGGEMSPLNEKYANALAAQDRGEFDEAIRMLLELLDEDEAFGLAHNDLGALLYQKNEKKRALRHFQKAVALDQQNLIAKKNLADLLFEQGEEREALDLYREVLQSDRDDVDALLALGILMHRNGRFDEARQYLDRILVLQPDHPFAGELLKSMRQHESPFLDSVCVKDERQEIRRTLLENEKG